MKACGGKRCKFDSTAVPLARMKKVRS